jgi:glycosyltransferase involved in cell wall biosynthesis
MSTPTVFRELALVANVRMPSERAHVLQIMQMASAFSSIFERVRLIYPVRANTRLMKRVTDPFDYYPVKDSFGLVGLPCIDPVKRVTLDWTWLASGPLPRIAHLIQTLTFTFAALMFVARMPPCVVYSRDLLVLTVLNLFSTGRGRLFIFEVHTLPRSGLSRKLHLWSARCADAVVTISDHIRDWYLEMGLDPKSVVTARDGVDFEVYSNLAEMSAARDRLGIESDAAVAVYTGHFFPWKGVDTLVEAARCLPERWRIFVVGGIEPDLGRVRDLAGAEGRIEVVGHLPARDAAFYLAAADVAVLPNSGQAEISAKYTSPLKLFEYLASGTPVVASDVPAVREVVESGHSALLVEPDDPGALAAGLQRVVSDEKLRETITLGALEIARQYSWNSRAALIKGFLRNLD